MCVHTHVHMHMFVYMHMPILVCIYGGQKTNSGVFPQGLSTLVMTRFLTDLGFT